MLLDPRGPRFAAGLTAVVFVLILVTGAWWLALAAGSSSSRSPRSTRARARTPCSTARWSRRASAPPTEREPAEPVRFAQALGGVFALTAAVAYLPGAGTAVGIVAAAFGLARRSSTPRSGSASAASSTWRSAALPAGRWPPRPRQRPTPHRFRRRTSALARRHQRTPHRPSRWSPGRTSGHGRASARRRARIAAPQAGTGAASSPEE